MANKRIYFAVQAGGIKGDGGSYTWGTTHTIHGLQSCAVTTNFNLQQIFTLGQLEIYENLEDIPDVEVSVNKVLDGYPLMYHMATVDATSPTLAGRSNAKCMFALAVYPDTNDSATGTPPSILACSGMFVGSVSFNFPLDDAFNEDLTLVGNNKVWKNQPDHGQTMKTLPSPAFTAHANIAGNTDAPIGTGGVNRRQDLIYSYDSASGLDVNGMVADPDATILPPDVHGITDSGTNEEDGEGYYGAHLQSITVSTDLGREEINELGRRGPYHRSVTFPIEVSCEIAVTATSGDLVSAIEEGVYGTGTGLCEEGENLVNRTIRIATCEGTRIYLGKKNKLASINQSGGDAGGGNVTVTYTFQTFNDFTVLHSGDPNSNGSTWWTQRGTYLVDA